MSTTDPRVRAVPSDRVLTVPNALTVIRILLVPWFAVLLASGRDLEALAVLVAASLTDFADGFIARHFDQMSRLGRWLDPAADRVTILGAGIALTVRGLLPLWILLVVIARDVAIVSVTAVLARRGLFIPKVTIAGKAATFLMLTTLPVLVAGSAVPAWGTVLLPLGVWCAAAGAILYWVAGVGYAVRAARQKEDRGTTRRGDPIA